MDRNRSGLVLALAVGTGTAFVFAWWWWWSDRKETKHRPPTKWRKVGELCDLVVFPIKSFGAVRSNSMECTQLGLKSGWLRDRTLMVVDLNGRFVTARQMPRMVQISPSVSDSVLTLRAPGMMSTSIDLAQIKSKDFQATVWEEKVTARDCGDEIALWLSRFLLQEELGLRLVYYPLERPARHVRSKNQPFPLTVSADTGAYPDATSYMLINEASIADLNMRIAEPVTSQHFRPNFVIKGAQPLEEDDWDWIKIGQIVFRNVKPCTRCIFTTIDPETGTKHPKCEPLKTLKKYRLIEDPALVPFTGDSPVMGIHMGLKGPNGTVRLGDAIYTGVTELEDEPSPPLVSST